MNPEIAAIISNLDSTSGLPDWHPLLLDTIAALGCTTGTLHVLEPHTRLLRLRAQQGIPEALLPKMSTIPVGKGMAGIAAERQQPVEMCNLQTDASGVAIPTAKETKVQGSIAAPMMLAGELYGVIGVAKTEPYDFQEEEISSLMQLGKAISQRLADNPA